ncbi:MAG: PAS domain S-box protein, partial [Brevinematales bacterium]
SFRVKSGTESLLCTIMRDITQSKQAEQKIRESEERFRNLADSTPIAILIYQHDRWIYANRAAEVISGYSREEILKMNFWDIVHPEDREMVREIGKRRQHGDNILRTYEVRIIRKDGSLHWVLVYGTGLLVEGKPAGLLSVMDITERKDVEKRLHEALEEREALLAALPDLLFIFDGEGRIRDFRAPDTGEWYVPGEDVPGKRVGEVFSGEIGEQFLSAIKEALEWGKVSLFSSSLTIKDTKRFSEVRCSKIDENRVLGVVRDITERKEMEERLRESEKTYRNLFQNSPVGLFRSRVSDGLILECNDQLAKLFGYEKREDVVGKLVSSQNYVDISVRQRMLEMIQKNGEVKNYEVLYRKRDGTTFWARYSARLYPEKGWIEGVFEVWEGHAPIIAQLAAGPIQIATPAGEKVFHR